MGMQAYLTFPEIRTCCVAFTSCGQSFTTMRWILVTSLAAALFLLASCQESYFIRSTSSRCPTQVLKSGRVRVRNQGKTVRYTCLGGYQLLGNKYSNCVRGKWDSPTPFCIKSGCSKFYVSHGQVIETYRGAFATVHCDHGYSLVGHQSVLCNGAVWNGSLPSCLRDKVIGGPNEGSCQDRCSEMSPDPDSCNCSPACLNDNTCCSDYTQTCSTSTEVSEWPTTQSETDMSTTEDSSVSVSSVDSTTGDILVIQSSTTQFPLMSSRRTVMGSTLSRNSSTVTNITSFVTSTTSRVETYQSTRGDYNVTVLPATNQSSWIVLSGKQSTPKITESISSKMGLRSSTLLLNPVTRPLVQTISTTNPSIGGSVKETNSSVLNHENITVTTIPTTVTSIRTSTAFKIKNVEHQVSVGSAKVRNQDKFMSTTLNRSGNVHFLTTLPSKQNISRTSVSNGSTTKQVSPTVTTLSLPSRMKSSDMETTARTTATGQPQHPATTQSTVSSTYFKKLLKPTKPQKILWPFRPTNKIIFNTPTPVIVYRIPKSTPPVSPTRQPPVFKIPYNPSFSKNATKNEIKSRNDVLHQGWTIPTSTLNTADKSRTIPQTSETSTHGDIVTLNGEHDQTLNDTFKEPLTNIASLKRESSFSNMEHILVWFCSTMAILTALLVVIVVRRRRIYRRPVEDDELDIRFLAPDEMLDFTIARPDMMDEKSL